MVLEYIVGATVFVSLISLVGVLLLRFGLSSLFAEEAISYLVSFATGAILAASFFDLLPESINAVGVDSVAYCAVAGLLTFFILEKYVHWHHHHNQKDCPSGNCDNRKMPALSLMILLGDGLHNFFDGVAIAAAFLVGIPSGFAVSAAVALHEIPHEIGDFSILLYGGMSVSKAAVYNLLSALTAVAGALIFYFASGFVAHFEGYGLAFALGNFLYIATVDLVPELHKEKNARRSALQFAILLAGIVLLFALEKMLGA